MIKYIVKRIAQAIPLLIIISIICFTLIQLAPFDAIDAKVTPNMSQKTIALIKAKYKLDKPGYVQYFYWIKGVLKGDLGYSIVTHQSIAEDLKTRIPATIVLVLPAYIVAVIIAILLGLISGLNRYKWTDKIIDGLCSVGIAIPVFWLAMVIVYFLGYKLKVFPILGMHTVGMEDSFMDFLKHVIMPWIVMTIAFLPELVRYVRSATIGQLSEDYVMVQNAYGASSVEILRKHILKNVLLPLITISGMTLPMLVTGAFITESIFSWPGVGPYFVTSIHGFDYPVVMAILLLSSTLVILGNLLSDILYCIVDPRIRVMR